MNYRTHFAHRIDMWDDDGENITEHLDGVEDFDVALRRLRAMGIRDRPIAPRSPWQNGCAERLIGSIRRDCLDHVIVFGDQHLRHLLKSYQKYCNEARTARTYHCRRTRRSPAPVQTVGQTLAVPILGGLHHQYIRA